MITAAAIIHGLGGSGNSAKCPGHDDGCKSFTAHDRDGKTMIHCHAGCRQEDLIAALSARGLWEKNGSGGKWSKIEDRFYPAAMGTLAREYVYQDAQGNEIYRKARFIPKNFVQGHYQGSSWTLKMQGVVRELYRLPRVLQAAAAGQPVILCEGEKDAETAEALGFTATTMSEGAGKQWQPQYTEALHGSRVLIIADADAPGQKHAGNVAYHLHQAGIPVKVLTLPGPGKDLTDWIQAGGTAAQLGELSRATPPWQPPADFQPAEPEQESEHWGEPLIFEDIEPPELDPWALPLWLGNYADAVATTTQTPPSMAILAALATLACCLQRKFEVAPYGDQYHEPLSLWTITALPPGNRKSEVFKHMHGPISEWEIDQAKSMKRELQEAENARKITAARIDELQRKAAKLDDDDARRQKIQEITDLQDSLEDEKLPPKLWVSDITAEQIQNLMVQHGERMAVMSDEGGIFEVIAGLYSGGQANLDIFLKGHAGTRVRVERRTRSAWLDRPALTFGLVVQPTRLITLGQGNKRNFRGLGLLARFMWCVPRSPVGSRDVTRHDKIPESKTLEFYAGIRGLLAIQPLRDREGREVPRTLELDHQALQIWHEFAQWVEMRQGDGREFEPIQDWTAKLPGAALRIAGLCHVAEHGGSVDYINALTMQNAVDMCGALVTHAQIAFGFLTSDDAIEDARYLYKWLLRERLEEVERRDMHRLGKFKHGKQDRLLKAIDILIERHILAGEHSTRTRTKPRIGYRVNPAIYQGGGNE